MGKGHAMGEVERWTAFLRARGAGSIPHSRGTLLQHLEGTRALLESWGQDRHTCVGGLFHSVYGTYVFDHHPATLDERDTVRGVIGERAEALAHLFGVSDRRSFFDAPARAPMSVDDVVHGVTLPVSLDDVQRLLVIEAANAVEQLPRRKLHHREEFRWYAQAFERHPGLVEAPALQAYREAYAAFERRWDAGS